MTKKQKEYNNRYALGLWNMCKNVINQGKVQEFWRKRLAYCNATVICYTCGDKPCIYMLKSYNTIVACVIVSKTTVYGVDMLRNVYGYTATSAQHISKFFNHYVDYVAKTRSMESLKLRYYA